MKSVFLSYSRDSEDHKAWVAGLGAALAEAGLAVRLDQDDLRPGSDLTQYMESSVRESDYVLLICTPAFAKRADGRVGGVGYEQMVVTGEIFSGAAQAEKFIPILRGDPATSIPSFLRSSLWVDFRDDSAFDGAIAELISGFGQSASEPKETAPTAAAHRSAADLDDDLRVYEEAVIFARSKTGLARTKASAEDLAEVLQQDWSLGAFRTFVQVFNFAKGSMKLSRSDAEDFALEWMEQEDYDQFAPYRDAFEFAVARDGMYLRPYKARRFVKEFEEDPGLEYFCRWEQAFRVARNSGSSRSDAEDFAYSQL